MQECRDADVTTGKLWGIR